jgi:hypothetical protein
MMVKVNIYQIQSRNVGKKSVTEQWTRKSFEIAISFKILRSDVAKHGTSGHFLGRKDVFDNYLQVFLQKIQNKYLYIVYFVESTFNLQIFSRPGSLQSPRTLCGPIFKRSKEFFHQRQ